MIYLSQRKSGSLSHTDTIENCIYLLEIQWAEQEWLEEERWQGGDQTKQLILLLQGKPNETPIIVHVMLLLLLCYVIYVIVMLCLVWCDNSETMTMKVFKTLLCVIVGFCDKFKL